MVGLLTAIDNRWPSDGLWRHYVNHDQLVANYFRDHEGFMAITLCASREVVQLAEFTILQCYNGVFSIAPDRIMLSADTDNEPGRR